MRESSEGIDRAADPVIDPVCGMSVDPAKTQHRFSYEGSEYFFCGAGCLRKFQADPKSYLNKPQSCCHAHDHHQGHDHAGVKSPEVEGAIYTCPMHPEIRQEGPGACPICGMALEPLRVTASDAPDPELKSMSRRFWFSLPLALGVSTLDMGGHALNFDMQLSAWIQLVLATPVVLWGGAPFFTRGWRSLVTRHLNMFTLIALGTGVAYLYSIMAVAAPDIFPASMRAHGIVPVYFEAASVITLLVLLGQMLELKARARTGNAIRALLDLAPKTARLVTADGNSDSEIALDAVRMGDRLRVRPGETVPVDGEIEEGSGLVDQSMLTGEAEPAARAKGDAVFGGTMNKSGSFVMMAGAVGEDTVLSRIVDMVATAQRSRAPIQSLADRVAGYFVPAVAAVAVLAFAGWMLLGPEPRLAHAILAAVSVLIIACPCALGLATPMSIMVGMGRGARKGILLRNAEALEALEKVDTLVIDKTGTLTEGKPKLVRVETAQGFGEAEVLALAASLERGSEHSLGLAILEGAQARGLDLSPVENLQTLSGKGVAGEIGGRRVSLGNAALFAELNIAPGAVPADADKLREDGNSVVMMAVDGRFAALLAVADPLRESAKPAIDALRAANIRIIMLTGDHRRTAEAVAAKLGIKEVEAEVLPERKHEIVEALKARGAIVAMAGDGINDAPALAAADVGIAMGSGTDIAMQSASVTLLHGDLSLIPAARKLSAATMRNIRQNLFFAFAYNALGVPLAAGLLYPVFGLLLSPVVAAAAMSLSSVSVIANALRLRAIKL